MVAAVDNGRERGDEGIGLRETAVTCLGLSTLLFLFVFR